ncbi:MAG: hypothetical protein LAT57_14415, partial [Balneolales bacterium]|nr:hypothetical protein [Balneolales bacterium]
QFSNFGQDFWLPVDIRIEGTIKFGFPGLQFPAVNFHQMSRLSNYEVNVPVPDTLFSISRRLIPETFLTGEDMPDLALVHLERHIPLDERESQAYSTLDSTQTLEKSFEPTGALARFVNNEDRESREPGVFGKAVRGFTPEIGYNRVDAGRFGVSYSPRIKGSLAPSVFAVYLSGTNDVDYGASLRYQARARDRRSRPLRVEAGYGYQTARIFEASHVHPLMASTGMLLGTYDYFDYYKVERGYVNASKRLNNKPITWNLGLNQSRFGSLAKTTNYSIPGGIIQRENPAIDEGIGRYVEVGLEFGGSPAPFGVTGGRNAEISVLHSGAHLGSDFDFTRFSARVDYRFETFFKRRFMPNTLDIRLTGGAALGDLPLQHMHSIDTSIRYFTPFGGLRAAQGVPIRSDRQLSLSWEHNFRTIPFEIIGFDAPVRKGIGFIVHGAHAYQHQAAQFPSGDTYHHEIGLSLNGLFSVLRIDATARIDRPGFFLGASVARIF